MSILFKITVNVKGYGSNYKYRTADIDGNFVSNLKLDDLEFVLNKRESESFNYNNQPMFEFLNSLSESQLVELTYLCLILNYSAPNDEIRNTYYECNDGESDFLYWLEQWAPELFNFYSTNEKFCDTFVQWSVKGEIIEN